MGCTCTCCICVVTFTLVFGCVELAYPVVYNVLQNGHIGLCDGGQGYLRWTKIPFYCCLLIHLVLLSLVNPCNQVHAAHEKFTCYHICLVGLQISYSAMPFGSASFIVSLQPFRLARCSQIGKTNNSSLEQAKGWKVKQVFMLWVVMIMVKGSISHICVLTFHFWCV